METIVIKTPLNVNVSVQHAGVGLRLLAFVLDAFFIGLYIYTITYFYTNLMGMVGGSHDLESDSYFDRGEFFQILYTLLWFPAIFYSLWTEMLFNGQTFGKMICKIRVVKLNGYRAGFPEYFTRWTFRFIDFWTGAFLLLFLIPIFGQEDAFIIAFLLLMLSGLVAFISIVRTKNSQRLGDIVAGTTVLKLREKHSIDITILEDVSDQYTPTYNQVMRLSDNDARIIKDTFTLAKKNSDYATMKRLRKKLESVMEVQSEQTDMAFIDTVMKDFNYFTQKL